MSESNYRLAKIILFGIAVIGGLSGGFNIGWNWSQVGRYRPILNPQSNQIHPLPVIDTTTGNIHMVNWSDP